MAGLCRGDSRISAQAPNLTTVEREYLLEAFDSGWVSSRGKFVEEFEHRFTDIFKTGNSLSCSSGTAALHLAITALRLRPGDEVIIPDLTFAAVAHAELQEV